MPIAHCFIKEKEILSSKIENMVIEWANTIGVEAKDICLNLITDFYQFGQQYTILVNLYLPTIWSEDDRKKIQMGLLQALAKYLHVTPEKIFIMTSLIHSGHVVENGEILYW